MRFSKEIIQQFVSYIDLNDVKSFVLLHPELVEKEEKKKKNRHFLSFTYKKDIIFKKQKIFRTIKNNYVIWNFFLN